MKKLIPFSIFLLSLIVWTAHRSDKLEKDADKLKQELIRQRIEAAYICGMADGMEIRYGIEIGLYKAGAEAHSESLRRQTNYFANHLP